MAKLSIDGLDALKYALDCMIEKEKKPLLTIELENETAVPKVFYKGQEVTNKVRVSFDWSTKEDTSNSGGVRYNIEHYEKEDEELIRKGVGLARGKYTI